MPIKDKNTSPDADFVKESVPFAINVGASVAGVRQGGWRAPWAGKLERVDVYCATITDADDSVRIDFHKNAASVLAATIDPAAADTLTAMPLTGGTSVSFNAGDVLKPVVTTGAGDAFIGTVTAVVRPLVGAERQAFRNSGGTINV